MKNLVITKWVEPYRLLEEIKQFYELKDYTFDGLNKRIQIKNFIEELKNTPYSVGLYMKNVNKFYLFKRQDEFDIENEIINVFELNSSDYVYEEFQKSVAMVDMAKAEAVVIIP